MDQSKHLIFDFGASNGRSLVAIFNGSTFRMEETHRFDNEAVTYAGTLHWDVLHLVRNLKEGIQRSLRLHPSISSIGIDTWGCDFSFIDSSGRLMANPVAYRDKRRYELQPLLHSSIPEFTLYKELGTNTITIMGLYQIFVLLHDNLPELETAGKFLMMADLLNYSLTGIPVNEYTNATMSLMIDQRKRDWHYEILKKLKVPLKWFSKPVEPGTEIGTFSEELCEELEIKPIPVIAIATHDTASAIAGIPISQTDRNWAFISLGTWCISGVEREELLTTKQGFKAGYGNQGGVEGRVNFVNTFTGMWIIQECHRYWCKKLGRKIPWDEIADLVEKADPGQIFFNVDDPDLALKNPHMPDTIVKKCLENGVSVDNTIGEVSRIIFQSLVLRIMHHIYNLQDITNQKIEVIHLVGGGIKNKILCQWIADALAIEIIAGPAETTSVGNLLMQLKSQNRIASVDEGRKIAAVATETIPYIPEPTRKKYWDDFYSNYCEKFPQ